MATEQIVYIHLDCGRQTEGNGKKENMRRKQRKVKWELMILNLPMSAYECGT